MYPMNSLDCKLVSPRSPKLGQAILKKFIQTLWLDNLEQSSTSSIMILWGCWMVSYLVRTRCTFSVLWLGNVTFFVVTFLKMFILLWSSVVYIPVILRSNGCGNVTSHPLLLRITSMIIARVFWCHFLLPNFWGWTLHKSSHLFSLSLSLRQLSYLKAQTT
jgi:hypothetical protein